MFSIIGIVVVIGSILGGFLMEKGNIKVLIQPTEVLIIGGAAIGTLLIANPLHILKGMVAGLLAILKGSPYTKKLYLETLLLLNDLFTMGRKEGAAKLEKEIEDPPQGQVFTKYPAFLKSHFATDYICDTIRMSLAGGVTPFDLEQLMEMDAEVHHHSEAKPVAALTTVADALPGLGIVAAVLGVVITMGALGGPPEEIGKKVAAALVGTFLGILLCYGFVGPMASNISKINDEADEYHKVLRAGMGYYLKGIAPILAIESSRRMIPPHLRPSSKELEEAIKEAKAGGAPAGGAPANG